MGHDLANYHHVLSLQGRFDNHLWVGIKGRCSLVEEVGIKATRMWWSSRAGCCSSTSHERCVCGDRRGRSVAADAKEVMRLWLWLRKLEREWLAEWPLRSHFGQRRCGCGSETLPLLGGDWHVRTRVTEVVYPPRFAVHHWWMMVSRHRMNI